MYTVHNYYAPDGKSGNIVLNCLKFGPEYGQFEGNNVTFNIRPLVANNIVISFPLNISLHFLTF